MHDLVPAIVVLFIFGGGVIKRILDIMERRMESKIAAQDQNIVQEIAAMRKELAQLRDTSTQYDMSIEHRLDDMERRLGSVETHGAQAARPAPQPHPQETQQTIGLPHP